MDYCYSAINCSFFIPRLHSTSLSIGTPGYLCINYLFRNTHDIYYFFDDGHETRAVFRDIQKKFDKV